MSIEHVISNVSAIIPDTILVVSYFGRGKAISIKRTNKSIAYWFFTEKEEPDTLLIPKNDSLVCSNRVTDISTGINLLKSML